MRDDDEQIFSSQVCTLHCPSSFSADGFYVDLPLACLGEQRIMYVGVPKTKQSFVV
ncbi:hypothetical protein DPMN_148055 [Dreissena polymorpha]|uniref:Uncharacterized protein n=1 Tax=Dreissena polymorpha TaxID=45954 RepID=A0A9D4FB02_DREPO|nr:hypothetical protein DPMN_148055 [Dreissena polymorpha]